MEEKSGSPDTARRQVVEVDGGDGDGPAPPAPKEYIPNAALTGGRGEQCAERGHGHGETTSARFWRPRCHAFG